VEVEGVEDVVTMTTFTNEPLLRTQCTFLHVLGSNLEGSPHPLLECPRVDLHQILHTHPHTPFNCPYHHRKSCSTVSGTVTTSKVTISTNTHPVIVIKLATLLTTP
jgi:hypothetical protein